MTTKKETPKKTVVKDQIKGKKIVKKVGTILILTIDKKPFNKTVTKEEADIILKKVETYNKKPSDKQREAIKKLMIPKATQIKKVEEKKVIAKKALEKRSKKENKKQEIVEKDFLKDIEARLLDKENGKELTPEEFSKLEQLLFKAKKVEEIKPNPISTQNPVRKEY